MNRPLTLATRNAFSTCAAFVARVNVKVRILAPDPFLGESLCESICSTPGVECSLFCEEKQTLVSQASSETEFTLIWIQPANSDLDMVAGLLQNQKVQQLITLQASRLGCKVLAEWSALPGDGPSLARIRQMLQPEHSWSYRSITVGNLRSLVWGFASGRCLALKRPDLADRCNARMRRHLFPEEARPGSSTLSFVSLAVFASPECPQNESSIV